MKVLAITGDRENGALLDEMYKLRARVFGERLGWSVQAKNGVEFDEFDTALTRYVLIVSNGQVLGCSRFLDFDHPTMIGTCFSHLIDGSVANISRNSIESSRFCIDTETMREWNPSMRGRATALLVSAMIGWAALHKYQSIVTVTDIKIERLLRRLKVPFNRLGSPQRLDRTNAVVGLVPVSADLAARSWPTNVQTPEPGQSKTPDSLDKHC